MTRNIPLILINFASRLRFKTLTLLVCALFILDLLVPDPIPFVDELLFGLLTVLLASLRKKPEGTGRAAEQ